MIAANNKIIVSVDYSQKGKVSIGDSSILLAKEFSTNRRESEPVLCEVEQGNMVVPKGTILLVHHNRFSPNSPHYLGGNKYSLAYNDSIFASVSASGKATGLCDNIIVTQFIDNDFELIPDQLKKPNKFKYRVVNNGFGFKKGDIVFAYEFANYEIVYVFEGVEHRVIKIKKADIVGRIVTK